MGAYQLISLLIKYAFLLLLLPWSNAECPQSADIAPCTCESSEERITQFSCRGPVGVSKLTRTLRSVMCGRSIEKFELRDSDIEYLPSNLFFKNRVKDIQVSFTNISYFTKAGRSAFYGLEGCLEFLSMRKCQLVDNLQWQMIGDLYALSYLDLSFNDLTKVPNQWFHHPPPGLLSIILKGNRISKLESGALSNMHKLIELDLSQNQIISIQRDSFPNPGNALLILRLNDNQLDSLPDDLFDEMMGLNKVYVHGNQLTTLSERVWSSIWGDVDDLDLSDNPLQCGCDMMWISQLRPPKRLYGTCQNLSDTILRNLEQNNFNSCIS